MLMFVVPVCKTIIKNYANIVFVIFGDMKQEADMFEKRLLELKQYKQSCL